VPSQTLGTCASASTSCRRYDDSARSSPRSRAAFGHVALHPGGAGGSSTCGDGLPPSALVAAASRRRSSGRDGGAVRLH
jgi:hypothetical protein